MQDRKQIIVHTELTVTPPTQHMCEYHPYQKHQFQLADTQTQPNTNNVWFCTVLLAFAFFSFSISFFLYIWFLPVAKLLVPVWGDIADPPAYVRPGGPMRQLNARADYIPQSGIKNLVLPQCAYLRKFPPYTLQMQEPYFLHLHYLYTEIISFRKLVQCLHLNMKNAHSWH